MIQSIEQALSGFSMVLFTVVAAVALLVLAGAVIVAIALGVLWASRQVVKEVSLPDKLRATVIHREKRTKPTVVRMKKEARG